VPECCIPDFLKNYEDIQNRYLAGDLSVILDKNKVQRGYYYKKRETYILEHQELIAKMQMQMQIQMQNIEEQMQTDNIDTKRKMNNSESNTSNSKEPRLE
jgi:hypothetical protein